jgi:hypothetical protein
VELEVSKGNERGHTYDGTLMCFSTRSSKNDLLISG